MPATLPFEEYGAGIGDATAVLRNNAAAAGLSAPVPTCPGWNVQDLVVHQGVVHRWATSVLTGTRWDEPTARTDAEAAGDLLGWLDDGMVDLLNALADSPAGLDVPFFLLDADQPRAAWARRQCHETTIHAVDAMSARLGRPAWAGELWFPPAFAADGIDELLLGFLPRPTTRLRFPAPARVAVVPDDSPRAWTISAGPDHATATLGADPEADLILTGSARQLYLALWNRGQEYRAHGNTLLLGFYRGLMRVTWH